MFELVVFLVLLMDINGLGQLCVTLSITSGDNNTLTPIDIVVN
jgi:hypothetical protein